MNRVALAVVVLALVGAVSCRDIALPRVGPGTLQATVVYSRPGLAGTLPAVGAHASLVGSGAATDTDQDGHFTLVGVTAAQGQVLITFDQNGDGSVDLQRLLDLNALAAGPGRDIVLGDVVLSRNSVVHGTVRRQGAPATTGLGGTVVFAPGGPWTTTSADDGTYTLDTLPQGDLQIAFFATGYAVASLDVSLGANDDHLVPTVELVPAPSSPAAVRGALKTQSGAAATDATVRLRGSAGEQALASGAEGAFSQGALTAGLYALAFERPGSLSVVLYNVLLAPGETDLGTITLLDGTSTTVVLPPPVPTRDGGGADGGAPDGGNSSDGGTDGGPGLDAGPDAGAPDGGNGPTAQVTAPALSAPGSTVTISGMSSTGVFPLTYQWAQGSGPPVTLSTNGTPLSHSPTFTAPAAGNVVTFTLVVTDANGASSAPATLRVPVGDAPVAAFVPDGGLVFGSSVVPLTSSSYDDAGIALVGYDWQLVVGTTGTLTSDGGASATWRAPAVSFGAPDVLAGVTLQVTNAIGVRSALTTQFFTVRGANPNNWAIDAGPQQAVNVGAAPGTVTLAGSMATAIPSPMWSVSWGCTPSSILLIGGNTPTPSFIAPAVAGPPLVATCTMTAAGQPPLDPPLLTSVVNVLLKDTLAPSVESHSVQALRASRLGVKVTASEPLSVATLTGCAAALGYGVRIVGSSALFGLSYNVLAEGNTCGPFSVTMSDTAVPANSSPALTLGPQTATTASAVWGGPYVSTSTFDDPRPVVVSPGPLPSEQLALAGASAGVAPWELVATQGGQLARFSGLDETVVPTCSPSCALDSTLSLSGLTPDSAPNGGRVSYGGADLYVVTSTDGGQQPTLAHRSPNGAWSTFSGFIGTPGSWDTALHLARVDAGQLLVDTVSQTSQALLVSEVALSGLANVSLTGTQESLAWAVADPNRTLVFRKRNPDASWSAFSATETNVTSTELVLPFTTGGLPLMAVEAGSPSTVTLHRVDQFSQSIPVAGATTVQGYDVAQVGGTTFIVYGQAGDVHLKTLPESSFSGAGVTFADFGGPPRVTPQPWTPVLDLDPLCEAAYPRFAFINEVLIVTWQERCTPQTKWQVVARTVR